MAARKKSETPTAAEVKEVADEVADDATVVEESFDAVIVLKEKTDDGGIRTKVVTNGSVQPTEVQTLLELAVLGWREQIGLGQSKR